MFSTLLVAALALGGLTFAGVLIALSMRKVAPAQSTAKPHGETFNRARVIASLARIVPTSQRVKFDAASFSDLPTFMRAALDLCGPEGARFVAAHTADGEQQSHSVTFEKHTFRVTVPAQVELKNVEPLLGLINEALEASKSARRVGMLFDQQTHWFAVLEPGFAARLERVGVLVAPPGI